MKKVIFVTLLVLYNSIYANPVCTEEVLDFYIKELNLQDYPNIKLKGFFDNPYGAHMYEDGLDLKINKEVIKDLNCKFYFIENDLGIFEINYISKIPKNSKREYQLYYEDFEGFHNDSDGQIFTFEPNDQEIIHPKYQTENPKFLNIFKNYKKATVIAISGLIIREKPSIKSKRKGELNFKSEYYIKKQSFSKEIEIKDNNKVISGTFRKIFLEDQEGYVFDGYLKFHEQKN